MYVHMHCTTRKIYCNWKRYVAARAKGLDYVLIEVLFRNHACTKS